jgi:acyl-CoA synthetase (AMP-forming)/AMP-acid ligase II
MFADLKCGALSELESGRSWSSQEIAARVASRTAQLHSSGLQRGDRLLILYGNNREFFVDLLAAWNTGASVVPVDNRLTPFELQNLARTVTPRLALTDPTVPTLLGNALASLGVKLLTAGQLTLDKIPSVPSISLACAARLDDEALILFTSGTTGVPKGVVHTHRSLRARWFSLRQSFGIECFRRTLCLLPTHFGHGLICNSLFPWLFGQDLIIAPAFSPYLLLRLGPIIDEQNITFLSSVPSMWGLSLKGSKPPGGQSLRRIHCGSAPLSAHLWRQIQEWSGIRNVFNAYGITETGSWVAGTSIENFEPEDGLVGEPWGAAIKILKSAEPQTPFANGAECQIDETGYVWINTPALMQGYYGQPELTDQVISGGWFVTGDMGLVDERGRFYLKGRERDEINKGGAKVYPADVDAVVERFEQAKAVCTFAIVDPAYGQNVAMAVVLSQHDEATLRQLHAWLKEHLAEFKIPQRWYVVEDLPKNSRGKVSRAEVGDLCAALKPVDLVGLLRRES